MITSTTTVTLANTIDRQAQDELTLELRLKDYHVRERCERSLDNLFAILTEYDSWKDATSLEIFRWGTKLLSIDPSTIDGDETLIKLAIEKIEYLRNKILISPIDGSPLASPVLEREWIWEEWQLKDYQSLNIANSPFDNEPIEKIRKHAFAEAIIKWSEETLKLLEPIRNRVSVLSSTSSSQLVSNSQVVNHPTSLVPSQNIGTVGILQKASKCFLNRALLTQTKDPLVTMTKLFTYCQRAREFVNTQSVRKLNVAIVEGSDALKKVWEQSVEYVRQQKKLAESSAQLHEQQISNRLDNIEQTHKNTTDILSGRIDDISGRLEREHIRADNLASTCQNQAQTISKIRYDYAVAMQQVEALRAQVNNKDDGGFCVIS